MPIPVDCSYCKKPITEIRDMIVTQGRILHRYCYAEEGGITEDVREDQAEEYRRRTGGEDAD